MTPPPLSRLATQIGRLPERLVIGAICGYRLLVAPWLGVNCRYLPSCSEYALDAVRRFGVVRGVVLAAGRVLRCRPGGGSGYDPVPERRSSSRSPSETR